MVGGVEFQGASFSDAQFNSRDTEMMLVDPGTKFSRYLQNFGSQRLPRPWRPVTVRRDEEEIWHVPLLDMLKLVL